MPADVEIKEEIRSIKTEKALNTAMFSLLGKYNFRKITVRDICEEALLSRATFYSRFADKYDFLKSWLMAIWLDKLVYEKDTYDVREQKINKYISENKTIIKNLFLDADNWTLDVLFDILHSILRQTTNKTIDGLVNPKYIVLSNFYVGGMIQYILWQVKNDFPQDVIMMNEHLHEVLKYFRNATNADGRPVPYE